MVCSAPDCHQGVGPGPIERARSRGIGVFPVSLIKNNMLAPVGARIAALAAPAASFTPVPTGSTSVGARYFAAKPASGSSVRRPPQRANGSIELSMIKSAVKSIGKVLKNDTKNPIEC